MFLDMTPLEVVAKAKNLPTLLELIKFSGSWKATMLKKWVQLLLWMMILTHPYLKW